MKLTRESLEKLYDIMSLEEMASHLKVAKSTLYYHMRKLGVKRRSKREAQAKHLVKSPHQRTGKKHTKKSVEKISDSTRRFWESSNGKTQKEKLGKLRKQEWTKKTDRQKVELLQRLQSAERPGPGELSKFGIKLVQFLSTRETVKTGIRLTPGHVSDIILEDRSIVIELLLPVSIYGDAQALRAEARYEKLTRELNDLGYRVVIIEDKSNSLSLARCQRVYDILIEFFENTNNKIIHITS